MTFLGIVSYYSISAFIDDSEQPDAPASLMAWCILTPVFFIFTWLANQYMLTDPMLPSVMKIVFLILELMLVLVVLGESTKDPIFACHITECTYSKLDQPKYEDEITSTWHAQSGEAALALFYFMLSLFFIPVIVYHIYRQTRVLMRSKDTSAYAVQAALQEFKEKHPDPHNEGGIEMNMVMTENPMLVQHGGIVGRPSGLGMEEEAVVTVKSKDPKALEKIKGHHRALHLAKIEADKEENAARWRVIEEMAMEHHAKQVEKREYTMWVCYFLTLGLLFPLNLFCSARFGNDFQWFSNYGMAAWAMHQIEPPIPQITVSDDLNYKFFPQIIIYYVFLYTVALAGIVSHLVPKVRNFFDTRPLFLKKLDSTWGEAAFTFMLVGFTWITFCYVFFDWYADPHIKWLGSTVSERWGRCLGQTALFPMGVMILPISRNSIWASLLNYPGEQMIKFHRWSATMFLVLAFSHTIAFFGVFHSLGEFPTAVMSSPNTYRAEDSTIGMMAGVQFFIAIPVFCILTFNYIRRNYFELFYFTHFASGIFFLATLWHSDFAWMYLAPGLTLYLVDILVRLNNNVKEMEIMKLRALEDDVTELSFAVLTNPGYVKKDKMKGGPATKGEAGTAPEGIHFRSGQYVFITLPTVSSTENHPFNIASAPTDRYTTCYIKSMGPGTFTGKLYDLAKSLQNSESPPLPLKYIPIHVEGPYGLPFEHKSVSSLLLLAGGIGITPLHSILRSLLLQLNSNVGLQAGILKKVKLIWSFKNPDVLFGNETIESTLLMVPPGEAYLRAMAMKRIGKSAKDVAIDRKSSSKHYKDYKDRKSETKRISEDYVLDDEDDIVTEDNALASRSSQSSRSLSRADDDDELRAVLAETRKQEELVKAYKQLDMSMYPTLKGDIHFEVNLHCTSSSRGPGPKAAAQRAEKGKGAFWHPLIPKRCNIDAEIGRLRDVPDSLVYCVGPDLLIKAAKEACTNHDVKFRGETSEF